MMTDNDSVRAGNSDSMPSCISSSFQYTCTSIQSQDRFVVYAVRRLPGTYIPIFLGHLFGWLYSPFGHDEIRFGMAIASRDEDGTETCMKRWIMDRIWNSYKEMRTMGRGVSWWLLIAHRLRGYLVC
ncbi:unnamed protein product [Tuber aestivum]|uniref:Uncharacterized protein n=1 Tax=Tuber aestivum TaxID=59557 RepID=A0A292PJ26_9PEZI|nr:unnamed protein product [Tuber aestivum]